MSKNLVKYEPWTPDQIDKEVEDLEAESEFLKIKEGTTQLRVLPKRLGTSARSPLVKVYQHYLDLPGLTSTVSFNCPRMMARRPCGACKKADELRATGNPADFDMAGEIRASKRVYANVINRANPGRGPIIWAFGKTIHEELMALAHNDEWGDFSDPTDAGYDIIITRKGTGKRDTRYKVNGARDCTPLSDDAAQVTAWLDMLHDLDRFMRVPSDEELARMLPGGFGVHGGSSGGGPRRRRGARAQDDVIDTEGVATD
jgi:hypothetical protein